MIAIVIVTVVSATVCFFCNLTEASLYVITPSKIEELRRSGRPGSERLAQLRAKIDESIAAILTLNTISNSLGATVAGSLVGRHFARHGDIATVIYGILFTIIILYFSEIIPKIVGVSYAHRLAPAMAYPVSILIIILKPAVWTGRALTRIIRHKRGDEADAPSEQEILALAEMGRSAGTIFEDEARWAVNALRLNDVTAKDLMTPRTVVTTLPAELPLTEASNFQEQWSYSRIPVINENDPDDIAGIVHRREVFDMLVHQPGEQWEKKILKDLARPAVFVPETIRCNELLKKFISTRQHLFIVTNEYGGTEGIISLEDVLEFLLGEEIVDPHNKHTDMQELARRLAKRRLQGVKPPQASPPPKQEKQGGS